MKSQKIYWIHQVELNLSFILQNTGAKLLKAEQVKKWLFYKQLGAFICMWGTPM
jgi:hypothetical protein